MTSKVSREQRESMSINERLLAESQFKVEMREKYPKGPPLMGVGTRVMTIYGPGVIVEQEERCKQAYPNVQFEAPPLHATGERFKTRTLRLFPYEYDFADEHPAIGSACGAQASVWQERIEEASSVGVRKVVGGSPLIRFG